MRLIDADSLLAELTSFYKKVEEESRYTGNRTINVSWDDAITAIKNTPTIEPEPHWIPVTERLPEIGVDVLVTEDTGGMKEVWTDSRWVDDDTGRTLWYVSLNVTAWMPLPEPYRADMRGEEE